MVLDASRCCQDRFALSTNRRGDILLSDCSTFIENP